jgi:hypothetical protein
VRGISKNLQKNYTSQIVYYLNIYFTIFGIFLDKNTDENLYKKIPETLISYTYIGNFKKFILENYNLIFAQLKEEVFSFLNLDSLKFIFLKKIDQVLKELKILVYLTSKEIIFNIIEFSDGLYFTDSNSLKKKDNIEINALNSFSTLCYFNQTYKNLSKKDNYPFLWKKKLLDNFTEDEFLKFCIFFRILLFEGLKVKTNILFLLSILNYRKSFLVLDIAIKSYGLQKIDDEELKISTTKYEIIDYTALINQIIFSSKYNDQINSIKMDLKLQTKIAKFIFNNECILSLDELKIIEKEIPQILIYCNRVFWGRKKNTKFK